MPQLDRIPRCARPRPEGGTPHDGAVVLHDDGARVERERLEQLEQRGAPRHRAGLPVDRDIDRVVHPFSSSSIRDRKSTRLNSSHGYISYAVFCLKKKKKKTNKSNISSTQSCVITSRDV